MPNCFFISSIFVVNIRATSHVSKLSENKHSSAAEAQKRQFVFNVKSHKNPLPEINPIFEREGDVESNETSNGNQPFDGLEIVVVEWATCLYSSTQKLKQTFKKWRKYFSGKEKLFQFSSIDRIARKKI